MPARQYRSTVEAKTLNQAITNVSSSIVLNSVTTLPSSYPYTLVIDPDTLTEEIVTVTASGGGNTLNVTRGQDGTTAQAHNLAAAVRHMITARDLQEPQDHINNGGYHVIVCTSTTRPASPVDGQHIYETDTDKTLSWDGTAWNPVSGAAAYQASAPANPSVGSLWVDSDETASQLNTNDFLLKSDASASTGYVSKVGGDTVVASGAAVKPLILKGAASQSANLQEWQNSAGTVVASVSPTGNIVGGGMVLLNTTTFTTQSTLSLNNVFTSDYANYEIRLNVTTKSADGRISLRYRTSGTDNSAASYVQSGSGFRTSNATAGYGGTGLTSIDTLCQANAGYGTSLIAQIFNPQVSTSTYANYQFTGGDTLTYIAAVLGSVFEPTTAFDGFTIYTASGTMTGTIRVYGLRN